MSFNDLVHSAQLLLDEHQGISVTLPVQTTTQYVSHSLD